MGLSREVLVGNPPDSVVGAEDREAWAEAVDRALGLFPCPRCGGSRRCGVCRWARFMVWLHERGLLLRGVSG